MKNLYQHCRRWALILILPLLLLASCSDDKKGNAGPLSTSQEAAEAAGELRERNNLVIAVTDDYNYGPQSTTWLNGATNTWESLVMLNENLEAEPMLTESFYPDAEGKIWNFTLKEGIKFHDGTELNAEAVKENLLRLSRHPDSAAAYTGLSKIEVVDPISIRIELDTPCPVFPERISGEASAVFSPATLDKTTGELKKPAGSGPYRLKTSKEGKITLAAFDAYRGGKPQLEEVVFLYIPDEEERIKALLEGEADVIALESSASDEKLKLLNGAPGLELFATETLTTVFMHFQTENEPFNNSELRRAVSLLINREELARSVLAGAGTPAAGILCPKASWWLNPEAAPLDNSEEAITLINRHRRSQNDVTILLNEAWFEYWPLENIACYLQEILQAAGFNAEILSLAEKEYFKELEAKNYHISFAPWSGADPGDFFQDWIHSEGPLNLGRGIGFANSGVDILIEQAAVEMNKRQRRTQYYTLQDIIFDLVPLSPLYHEVVIWAIRDYVKSFSPNFNSYADLKAVHF